MTSPVWLPALALAPFAGAALLGLTPPDRRQAAAWLAGAVALACLGCVLALAPAVFGGEVPAWRVDWLPQAGLAFRLRMDGLAWLFALLVSGIGALIVLYAAWYLHHGDPAVRFFMFLLMFKGAMLGVVLADNLLLLAVFWELTSLTSFLLIGYWHYREEAREGARMALAITGAGGLALLGGVLLLGHIVGSYDLDTVLASGALIRAHPLYLPALVLVLAGAFTKSAQFPFHFWLPHAMAAPTPVSAYLHSATMVKAGVFLLARLYPALGGSEPWFWLVTCTGLATLLVGAYIAIFQHDLKGLLAYSTISHLGLITLLFGLNRDMAVVAGVFHILNHATFKASLFMSAGIIDHETGTRDMRVLSGLWRHMPVTGALAMVAAGAMAGVPLANGFLSKEMFFGQALEAGDGGVMSWLLPLGALLAAAFSVAYSVRFIHEVFFHSGGGALARVPHEPPRFMRIPVELLVLLCLAVGVLPGLTVGPLLAVGAQAALHGAPGAPLPDYELAVWHGFNLPLLMSLIALVAGTALYFGLRRATDLHGLVHLPRGGREVFAFLLEALIAGASRVTATLQSGRLQSYLSLLVGLAILAGLAPWLEAGVGAREGALTPAGPGVVAVGAAGAAAALATVAAYRHRLLAVVLLGAVGLVVSLTFVYLSAPDLALTQLLVEVVTLVLIMLALHWLPAGSPRERGALRRLGDLLLAAAAGLGVTLLTLGMLTRPSQSISSYFLETAKTLGGGANAVNVIIVDYRGFDTLGEIAVLGIAAVIVHALLADLRPVGRVALPGSDAERHPLMLAIVSRLVLPLAVVVSLHLFVRGHNLPGGGFIAGLVLGIALVLQYVAGGKDWVRPRLRSDFRAWIGWGLLVAGLTGVGSWLLGQPFLTSSYDYPVLPLLGPIPLASAMAFDLGVYLTVIGATLVTLQTLAALAAPPGGREAR